VCKSIWIFVSGGYLGNIGAAPIHGTNPWCIIGRTDIAQVAPRNKYPDRFAHKGLPRYQINNEARAHDLHHEKFNLNYGSLGLLDWVHGTDKLKKHNPWCIIGRTDIAQVAPRNKYPDRFAHKGLPRYQILGATWAISVRPMMHHGFVPCMGCGNALSFLASYLIVFGTLEPPGISHGNNLGRLHFPSSSCAGYL
jgi:hypothetical protein